MRRRILAGVTAALLTVGFAGAGTALTATAAQAAGAAFISTPNGLTGVAQEIVIFAPTLRGQAAAIGLALGANQTMVQTVINSQGYGYAQWTPTAGGVWTVSGLGNSTVAGSTTISVATMPTTTVVEAPNFIQQGVNNPIIISVTAPGGTVAPTGTVTLYSQPSQTPLAMATVNPVGTSTTSVATISYNPGANVTGTIPMSATFTPSTGGFSGSSSTNAAPVVTTSVNTVTLAFPPNLNVGQPVTLTAILGNGIPGGSVAFLVDGQGISPSIGTVNGEASFTWTPNAGGTHVISAQYTGSYGGKNYSGTATQPIAIGAALPKDVITVDPQPGAPWGVGTPVTLSAGTTITLGATSASGAPVVLSENGPCIINGAALTARAAGQCQVTAYSPGSPSYLPISQTYLVSVTAPPSRPRR